MSWSLLNFLNKIGFYIEEPSSRINVQYRKQSDVETGETEAVIRYSDFEPKKVTMEIIIFMNILRC